MRIDGWETNLVLASRDLRPKVLHNVLRFKIPDLDGVLCGCAEPVAVGREAERVDDGARVQRVQPLALSQVPQQGSMVFPSGGAQRTIRTHSDGVDVPAVTLESAAELAVGEVPDLDAAVPGAGDDRRL